MDSYIDQECSIEEPAILDGVPAIIVNFYGCNFSCPFCYSKEFSSFKNDHLNSLRTIKDEIKRISPNADQILFTGGEPILQRSALLNLAKISKDLNLNTVLFTNGSKFAVIRDLVNRNLIDKFLVTLVVPLKQEFVSKFMRVNTFFVKTSQVIDEIRNSINYINLNNTTTELEIVTPIIPKVNDDFEILLKLAEFVYTLKVRWNLVPFSKRSPYDGNLIKNEFTKNIDPPTVFHLQSLADKILDIYPALNIRIREEI